MTMSFGKPKTVLTVAMILLALAACAPDNLDITPSPTPTSTPEPTATRTPTPTPDPDATAAAETTSEMPATEAVSETASEGDMFEQIIATFPTSFNAGAQWRRVKNVASDEDATYTDVDGGRTMTIYFEESSGSQAEITIGMFESMEAAEAYYNVVIDRTRILKLANAQENPDFPSPNRFGQGTDGYDGIVLLGPNVVRVSVPLFSSAAGSGPAVSLMRNTLRLLDPILGAGAS